jgi:glycerophosphoryl diester phosphodiesterase
MNINLNVPDAALMLMKLTGANVVYLSVKMAGEQLIKRTRRLGFFSFVWTVNDPQEMERLSNLGVNGIITDRPDLMLDQLVESH